MNTAAVDKLAKALLYEGYMLYPYRPSSVKNQQRFNFGVLHPRAYSEKQESSDAWFSQTECLIQGGVLSAIEIKVRFLHLGQLPAQGGQVSDSRVVAVEREISLPVCSLMALASQPLEWSAAVAGGGNLEPIAKSEGSEQSSTTRSQRPVHVELEIAVEVTARRVMEDVFKVAVRVKNADPAESIPATRDEALMRSSISTHTVLGVQDGEFVSLLDPPETLRSLSEHCQNIGTFPVLVGERERRDTMLSSPIILYDYPEIAGESAGDLFDALEIDEILSLRIMTLTDEEKLEIRNSDDRARRILERTENLPQEQLMKLHGALRGMRPLEEERTR